MAQYAQPASITPPRAPSQEKQPLSPASTASRNSLSLEEEITLEPTEEEMINDLSFFRNLAKKDEEFILSPDFLDDKKVNPRMRTKLIKWMRELIQDYGFKLDTYFFSIMVLDKYLQKADETPKHLQLVGAACLYIASKISESKVVPPSIYVYSASDIFNVDNMLSKEKQILVSLAFNISFPTVTKFIKAFNSLDSLQFQEAERMLILLDQSTEFYKYSRLQLSKLLIVLVKAGHVASSLESLREGIVGIERMTL